MFLAIQRRWRSLVGPAARLVLRLRRYEFRDCRLILEQDGDVHYLLVPATLQRRATQVAAAIVACTFTLLMVMAVISAALSLANGQLERSHENIYRALLETYGGSQAEGAALSKERMLALASAIRQRNSEIRRFVDHSLASIDGENAQLREALQGSGLTEQAIRIIQTSTPVGGYAETVSVGSNLAQVDALAQVIAKNRSLRDVLDALPSHLPLGSSGVSSGYGLRIHPLTGKTQFHTGVDLIPTSDLLIHPALRGKVVLASYGQELGNVVIVRHAGGIETLYGHMASIAVHEGAEVSENSVLGIVGNTGSASTGRHLHFEVIVGGYPVNPLKVIQTAQNVRQIEARR